MTDPHELTEAGARTFRDASVDDAERDRWLAAGFGPLASVNHVRAGASVDDAVLARSLGLDSRSIARAMPRGISLDQLLTDIGRETDLERGDLVALVRHAGSLVILRDAMRAGMTVGMIRGLTDEEIELALESVGDGASLEAAVALARGATALRRTGPSSTIDTDDTDDAAEFDPDGAEDADDSDDSDDADDTDDTDDSDDEDSTDGSSYDSWAEEIEEIELGASGFASLAEFAATLDPDEVVAVFDGAQPFVIDGRPMAAVVVDGTVIVEPAHLVGAREFDPGAVIQRVLASHSGIELDAMGAGTSVFTLGTTSSGFLAAYDEMDGETPQLEVWRSTTTTADELLRWFERVDSCGLLPMLAAEALAGDGTCDTVGAALDDDASETLELSISFGLTAAERAELLERFDAAGWGAERRAVSDPASDEAVARSARRRLLGLDD